MKGQEKSPVEREDLYEFRFVSEASLSPDGTMAVCVVNQASKEDNTYHSSIWSVDLETKEKRLLASRGEAKKACLDGFRTDFIYFQPGQGRH